MSATVDAQDLVAEYLDLAVLGRGVDAVRFALDHLDRGATVEALIVDVLAAAQRESGERWQRNEWSVADEHLVSGVTQRTLDAVAGTMEERPAAGSVVVACAEGDWHSLPAQMGAELLRARGFAVSFLGASTPADHVARLLDRHRPDALVVSCNLPLFYAGVIRLADAAHGAGVPVVAGGRAVRTPSRARALGADAWGADIAAVAPQIRGLAGRPQRSPRSPSAPVALLDAESRNLASRACDAMVAAHPFMRRFDDRQLARAREDLAYTVRYVAAAALVDETGVLVEYLDWLRTVLAARGVPATAIVAGLETLIPLVAAIDPAAGQLALAATDAFSG
ncbi:MAG: hypothetical protein JWO77_1032 [Ilumatobacteraceae bacterium]|nr:hypothetical protein [Ilumatobacteraceae bacterium]